MSLVQLLFPAWNQPVIAFLIAGLLSLLVFRWCFMALTSFLGSALLAYAELALLHYYGMVDAFAWGDEHYVLLNSICGGITLFGFLFQFLLDRRQIRSGQGGANEESGPIAIILGVFDNLGKSKRKAA